ncbi:MAG TPA: trypsin-like peptidase domain-containing protein [Planctomycetota bacterium]|nr:trypsin-like peptidase domain-containing protein [Planctomycetota bacterium]
MSCKSPLVFAVVAAVTFAQEPPAAPPCADARPASRPADATLRAALDVEDALVAVADGVMPSVVTVRAYLRGAAPELTAPANENEELRGWGGSNFNDDYPGYRLANAASGIIVSPSGDVLTCLHFLQKKDGTFVDLVDVELQDRSRVLVEVLGAEPTVNLAVLRARVFPAGRDAPLPAARFGDSDALRRGQFALAAGDPVGPEKFFGVGTFVARPTRDCYQELLSSFFISCAMTAPPQAYGGPLLNLRGEVVGMLSPRAPAPGGESLEPRYGVEFALPSKILAGLYRNLSVAQSVRSPWLGFSVMSRAEIAAVRGPEAFNAMDKPRHGILIENVFTPSPAAAAGVKPDDFLVAFDGAAVQTPVDFQKYLYLAGVGRKVTLEIYRAGASRTVEIVVDVRPPEARPR